MAAMRGSGQLLNNLRKMHRLSHFSTNSRVYSIAGDVKAADKASKKSMTGGGVLSRLAEKTWQGPCNSRDKCKKVVRDMRVALEEDKKLGLRIQTLDELRSDIRCEDSLSTVAEYYDTLLREQKEALLKEYLKSGAKFKDLSRELKLAEKESRKELQAWCNRLKTFNLFIVIATGALVAHVMY